MIKLKNLLKEQGEYGGQGPFKLPKDHIPGIQVPKGGAMCANCKFISKDKLHCTEDNFIKWHGDSKIPKPIDEYCSDFYEPNTPLDEKIVKKGSKYAVTTKNGDRTLGTHSSKKKAQSQLAAIEINKHKKG